MASDTKLLTQYLSINTLPVYFDHLFSVHVTYTIPNVISILEFVCPPCNMYAPSL